MYKERSNQVLVRANNAECYFNVENNTISLSGGWSWSSINEKKLNKIFLDLNFNTSITIDARKIESLDTSGVFFINKLIKQIDDKKIKIIDFILPENESKFFVRIADKFNESGTSSKKLPKINTVTKIGSGAFSFVFAFLNFLEFFGHFCINFFKFILSPLNFEWKEVVYTVENAGIKGIWVSSLLAFLIGVTLTYEMSPQFITYGANIFIVNFLGISLLKEVIPLLTAIIVAGRTGSAITAEIGVMKVQEEIDAIQTMGISPFTRIVLPKIMGVMIATPLITTIADTFGLFGGAIVANSYLDINYTLFLERLQNSVAISNFTIGLVKSVAFAFVIALAGCICGFRVKGNANSIGEQTTKSVVLGIVFIVFFDAVFAVLFKAFGV